MARLFGKTFLALAGMLFVAGASLFVLGSFLITWPILRLAPRDRRLKAGIEIASAAIGAVMAFKPEEAEK